MKQLIIGRWRHKMVMQFATFVFLVSCFGAQTTVQHTLSLERSQEGAIAGSTPDKVNDTQDKTVRQYYFAVTNGLAAIEEIIESQSLFYAVNMRTLTFRDNASRQAYTSKWTFDVKQHVEELIGVFDCHEDAGDQLKDEVELLRGIVSCKVLMLETYLSGMRRTREEWINVLNREEVLELMATEAHCKAELFREVESKIREMQNSGQGGVGAEEDPVSPKQRQSKDRVSTLENTR